MAGVQLKGEEMPGRKRVAREFEKLVKSEVKSEVCTEVESRWNQK